MLFNSFEFIFAFLPAVWLVFFASARIGMRAAALWLTLASLFFYGWWNPRLLWLLLASAAANFLLGRILVRLTPTGDATRRSHAVLVLAVGANLMLLGYYKYTDFLIQTANALLTTQMGLVHLVLPLGISFFTFTQIAYLVDVHRGKARDSDPVRYLLFVTYFPHLIAGPVIHHQQMMPQFALPETFRPQRANIESGLAIFAIGLFKKVVLADQLALLATPVFDGAAHGQVASPAAAWVGALAYALQLYFDFSGYSDMAVGLSRLFNIALPLNFESPYKANNLIDFWRRWHMTLSAFLREYLYITLGGNRHGALRRHVNLFLTMLLGGLWHGASWNFVLWGALHGAMLVVNHGWRGLMTRLRWPAWPGGVWLGRGLTFLLVTVAWVPFRATDLPTTWGLWASMVDLGRLTWADLRAQGHMGLLMCLAMVWCLPNAVEWVDRRETSGRRWRLPAWRASTGWGVVLGGAMGVAMMFFSKYSPFLYFQF